MVVNHVIDEGQTKEEKLNLGRDSRLETTFETQSQTAEGVVVSTSPVDKDHKN